MSWAAFMRARAWRKTRSPGSELSNTSPATSTTGALFWRAAAEMVSITSRRASWKALRASAGARPKGLPNCQSEVWMKRMGNDLGFNCVGFYGLRLAPPDAAFGKPKVGVTSGFTPDRRGKAGFPPLVDNNVPARLGFSDDQKFQDVAAAAGTAHAHAPVLSLIHISEPTR